MKTKMDDGMLVSEKRKNTLMALDKNIFNVMQNMGLRDIIRSPAKSILIDRGDGETINKNGDYFR